MCPCNSPPLPVSADHGRGHSITRLAQPAQVEDMCSHRPVMLQEVLAGLALNRWCAEPRVFIDATYGRGGHAAGILEALQPDDVLHALDCDPEACDHARRVYGSRGEFRIHHRNFAELGIWAEAEGLRGKVNGLLMDLGISSPQIDQPERGFSFTKDGPLDMRMNPMVGESAAQWLAQADEDEIACVLWQNGEERNSRRIARRIVETRAKAPLTTTSQLATLVASVPGPRSRKIHPATRTFQAIRLHVNTELLALESALAAVSDVLAPGGRLVVISFHSLEDRIVKRYIRAQSDHTRNGEWLRPQLRRLDRRFPTVSEIQINPRARSAVLRVAEHI